MTKSDLNDSEKFAKMEELAIDGQLDYSELEPAEYRYFSRLSKLGYNNRHKGWSSELCEKLQQEYRTDYQEDCDERGAWFAHAQLVQSRIKRTSELSRKLNFAKTSDEALLIALELVENLLEEPGLANRVYHNVTDLIGVMQHDAAASAD